MKRVIASLIVALFLVPGLALAADTYKLDPGHTFPNFTISHLGFSTLSGRFNETSGTVVMDRKGGMSSVDVTVQMPSVDTGNAKRDEHLRSDTFFNVKKYPTMTYKSDKVYFHDDGTATVMGKLTLHGTTRPVTLYVDNIHCGTNPINKKAACGFNAIATIKRSNFGIDAYIPAVGDEVDIRIEAEAFKQ